MAQKDELRKYFKKKKIFFDIYHFNPLFRVCHTCILTYVIVQEVWSGL